MNENNPQVGYERLIECADLIMQFGKDNLTIEEAFEVSKCAPFTVYEVSEAYKFLCRCGFIK